MTNSEGITKAECRALVAAIKQGSGPDWRCNLVIGASLELGGWDLGFPQPAVARQKIATLDRAKAADVYQKT